VILTECWIPGQPKTKGSLNFVGDRYVEENVKGSARWRVLVADAVRRDRVRRGLSEPATGPVAVRALFWLPVDPIKPRAGDVDKLARNVLDAPAADAKVASKNGGAFVNDNQVCDLLAVKMLATPQLPPGLALTVWELERDASPAYSIAERVRIEAATLSVGDTLRIEVAR
jgi:hypothetical protein